MRHSTIGITLLFLSLISYIAMEVLENYFLETCPLIFSIIKSLLLFFLNTMIILCIKNQSPDCLFIAVIIYLIYSCILFFFHILLELSQYDEVDDDIMIYYNIIVLLNIFTAFGSFFASIFLFLFRSQMKEAMRSKYLFNFRAD
jgi:hypothetical protein